MNILFVSNTAGFNKFIRPYMRWFLNHGWRVDNASPGIIAEDCNNHYSIPIARSPFSLSNMKAYRLLKNVINDGQYHIVHCHTPMGAFLARLAVHFSSVKKCKVIYTAHGFHFFKGSSIITWLLYYPIEKLLSKYTDCLVTINEEDYSIAIKRHLCAGKIFKIGGIGTDLSRFTPIDLVDKNRLRVQYGYDETDFILLYTAQFIERKNHKMLIELLPILKKQIPTLKVVFAGSGVLIDKSKRLCKKLAVDGIISFGGDRNDVSKLCQIADIHVSTSKQEGLSMNNVEAMACGLPIVCSRIRGHVDVVKDGRNGCLFSLNSKRELMDGIIQLYKDENMRKQISKNNIEDVTYFSLESSLETMGRIYSQYM